MAIFEAADYMRLSGLYECDRYTYTSMCKVWLRSYSSVFLLASTSFNCFFLNAVINV